ncbi:hypothetical protein COR50_02890 [Chitinophaga caeni]|uniref:Uncharacterized protein n=1 Tax=Chitinophaga caeni TaxID=2029983 RepID=A0A291QQC6_9BACT|nr:DUF6134 family protein [Chitinophaga caeni]ATL46198.1 hypothetical protein COR50_02890 [Chitinophaga caeni]
MRIIKCAIIVLLTLCAPILYTAAQTVKFKVFSGNKQIGIVEAHQKQAGVSRSIHIKSLLQLKLVGNVNNEIAVEYKNNNLVKASSIRLRNDNQTTKDKKSTLTELVSGKHYKVIHEGKESVLSTAAIHYCVGDLYFTEPINVHKVYSETQCQFLELEHLGNGKYELIMPDGKRNIYAYSKGKLQEVEVNHLLGKAVFKLADG